MTLGEAAGRVLASLVPCLPIWRTSWIEEPYHRTTHLVPIGSAWCAACHAWHGHSYAPGLRLAHCKGGGTGGSYTLAMQGDAPLLLLRDMKRRKPRGPAMYGLKVRL